MKSRLSDSSEFYDLLDQIVTTAERSRDQPNIGMAMLTLMDSTVMPTITHKPSTSVAATASIRRDDARGKLWPLKPVAPDSGVMVKEILVEYILANTFSCAGANHFRDRKVTELAGKIAAAEARKKA
jgi:hypothetical protein